MDVVAKRPNSTEKRGFSKKFSRAITTISITQLTKKEKNQTYESMIILSDDPVQFHRLLIVIKFIFEIIFHTSQNNAYLKFLTFVDRKRFAKMIT
jgi:hypothetical protein